MCVSMCGYTVNVWVPKTDCYLLSAKTTQFERRRDNSKGNPSKKFDWDSHRISISKTGLMNKQSEIQNFRELNYFSFTPQIALISCYYYEYKTHLFCFVDLARGKGVEQGIRWLERVVSVLQVQIYRLIPEQA